MQKARGMKLRAAVTVLGKGFCDAQHETPTVEGAVGPIKARGEGSERVWDDAGGGRT
jgi:hypothetical protein